MPDFSSRFKSHSIQQLLEILENRKNYQFAAIRAVEEELAARNISEGELARIKKEMNAQKLAERQREQEIEEKRAAARKQRAELVKKAVVSPITTHASPIDKAIKAISIVFGVIFIILIFSEAHLLHFMFTNSSAKWDVSVIGQFTPFLILPVAIVLFWKKKKMGWSLLVFYMVAHVTTAIFGLIFFSDFFPVPAAVGALLIFGGTLILVCTARFRDAYRVSTSFLVMAIIGASALTFIYWFNLTSR